MAALVNTPTKYTGATGFVEIALPTAQAKETGTLVPFVYKGAQHDASASGITSTNFVITDVSGALLPSYLTTFTAYNNMELYIRFPNVSTSSAQYVYLQWGSGITRSNNSAALTGANAVAAFPMGEASGNIVDIANGYAGVPISTPAYSQAGVIGNAVADGLNGDGFQVTHSAALNGIRTITGWINLASAPATYSGILRKDDSGDAWNNGIGIYFLNSTTMKMYWGAYNVNPAAITVGTGSWINFAGTWDGTNVRSYKNGALIETAGNGSATTNTTDLFLGLMGLGGDNTVRAAFDYFVMYSDAKSTEWLLRAYNNENGFATDAIFTVSDTSAFARRLVGASTLFGSVLIGQSSLIG